MSTPIIALVVVGTFLGLLGGIIYLTGIFQQGILDVRYPRIADGDYHTGWRRRLYLAGVKRGKFTEARDKERRRITVERREGES